MIYQIQQTQRIKLSKVYKDSMRELDSFFRLNWKRNRPRIILMPDRKTIDCLRGKKTARWIVGWAEKNNVFLLDDKNFEKESNHKYSREEYHALLKHELAHCFSNIVSDFARKPVWLFEGISIFLSGQNKLKPKPSFYNTFIDFYNVGGSGVYKESGFAVEFLIKKYGKRKFIFLLKKLKESHSKKDFAKLFKAVYGFDLSYKNFKIL